MLPTSGRTRTRRCLMPRRISVVLTATVLALLSMVAAVSKASADPTWSPHIQSVGQIDQQDIAPLPDSEPDTLVEPDIEVSPTNPDWAVAAAHDGRYPDGGAVDISYAWTHDGGKTWHHAPVPGIIDVGGRRLESRLRPGRRLGAGRQRVPVDPPRQRRLPERRVRHPVDRRWQDVRHSRSRALQRHLCLLRRQELVGRRQLQDQPALRPALPVLDAVHLRRPGQLHGCAAGTSLVR